MSVRYRLHGSRGRAQHDRTKSCASSCHPIQRRSQEKDMNVLRRGLADLERAALPLALVAVMLAGTLTMLSSTTSAAATSATRALALSTNGMWPGVGKIC